MTFKLSQKSLDRMSGVHPDLIKVVKRAIELTQVDFGITEGLRTVERQKQLVAEGKSQTMKSRHITGHAVDVVAYTDGKISWEWKLYEQISKAFKQASADVGVPIEWGGDWKSLKDGPHFQLPVGRYPA